MAEARRLNAGLWRIYLKAVGSMARRPRGNTIATFYSLAEARRWWQKMHPKEPPLQEAPRCGWCGAYFDGRTKPVTNGGRSYHGIHTPFGVSSSLDLWQHLCPL